MTLKDHILSTPFNALVPELIMIDSPVLDNLYAFKEAYDILRRMKPAWPQEEFILATIHEPDEDGPDLPLEQRIYAQHCGGVFWENDLAKEVVIEDGIPTPVALAEILWEMTFYSSRQRATDWPPFFALVKIFHTYFESKSMVTSNTVEAEGSKTMRDPLRRSS